MHPVSKSTKKAYRWGNGGIGWPIVDTKGLLVVEETLAPGCGEKHHYFNQAAQCFYMLVERAVMQFADGQSVKIDTGMALYIPPEICHAIVNKTGEAIRFPVISAPSSRVDRHEVEREK